MNWSGVANMAKELAPTIATCVGGPLAGTAVTALEGVFNLTPKVTSTTDQRLDAVAEAMAGATPDQLAAVRKADQDFQAKMSELGFKDIESLAALEVQDLGSARTMQSTTRSWVPPVLTILITVGFFGLVATLMLASVPEANKAIMYSLIGSLGTAWIGVVHFWFGDTMASTEKTNIIAKAQPVDT